MRLFLEYKEVQFSPSISSFWGLRINFSDNLFTILRCLLNFIMHLHTLISLLPALVAASPPHALISRAVAGTSTIDLSNNTGKPQHLASGILYGIPDTKNQIPDHFYTDIGFNYARAGGAQVAAPGRGWIWGLSEYKVSLFHYDLRQDE
jgi:hypothetical protein